MRRAHALRGEVRAILHQPPDRRLPTNRRLERPSPWTSNVLKIGTTRTSMSIEVGYVNISEYRLFTGAVVNQMVLNCPTNALVSATFDLMAISTGALTGNGVSITGVHGWPASTVNCKPVSSTVVAVPPLLVKRIPH